MLPTFDVGAVLALIFLLLVPAAAPVWKVDDELSIPEPKERRVGLLEDVVPPLVLPVEHVLDLPRDLRKLVGQPKEAEDVNTVDEVPDSSWFTNRNFLHPLSPEEFANGPENLEPPDAGPWTLLKCKATGASPGFRIRDNKGNVYLLKFDPEKFPEMASAADTIGSKFLYAAGYNVPQDSVVEFDPNIIIPNDSLQCVFPGSQGKSFAMNAAGILGYLEHVGHMKDGRVRGVASKYLDGELKGPFSFLGVRADDPNDRIPHQHRRELRGLRVFTAFLNDTDLKQSNTLDSYVEENDRKFIKHNLIDFGNSLGSSTNVAKKPGSADAAGNAASTRFPAIGYFEGETFRPERWGPELPNAAFENMTERDGYWAAKAVAAFTDQQITAAVRAGRYSDPAAERLMIEILKQRRDRIADYWFHRIAPLDRFHMEGNALRFNDLAIDDNRDKAANVIYRIALPSTKRTASVLELKPGMPVPLEIADDGRVEVQILRSSPGWPNLSVVVDVQKVAGVPMVVGIKH